MRRIIIIGRVLIVMSTISACAISFWIQFSVQECFSGTSKTRDWTPMHSFCTQSTIALFCARACLHMCYAVQYSRWRFAVLVCKPP